jgi:hypothetical protein
MTQLDPEYAALLATLYDAEESGAPTEELVAALHARYLEVAPAAVAANGLPYPLPTDPVAQGADAIRALAEAIILPRGAMIVGNGITMTGSPAVVIPGGLTLPAGTWHLHGSAVFDFSAGVVPRMNLKLRNSTDGVDILSISTAIGTGNGAVPIVVSKIVTLTKSTVIDLMAWTNNVSGTQLATLPILQAIQVQPYGVIPAMEHEPTIGPPPTYDPSAEE